MYEYASRGSLDRHLSDATLMWMQRLRICLASARGLSYLHDPKGTQHRVLHCDIKSLTSYGMRIGMLSTLHYNPH
ncbi:Protein kinase, catalytic domain-containing protein [Cynara cardunculus var. scolymus]|uniref:Protein kinase, catalytic domain-containing protein n=1 Tax=Cynara cardunculus var. scolymus TaxID=59895 RepID=A0A118JUJ4_CYNCS|nr:Protein kinase, catalytic domain-containing protein [Cynara cardunculus var. scolymus]